MKALIIGAGVCGPVMAMALGRAGIDAAVFEGHAQPTTRGSYLTVATNGLDALRAIDAERSVIAAGFPTLWTLMSSGSGKALGRVPIGSSRPGRDASITIARSELHRALQQEALGRGIAVQFGKRLAATRTDASSITACFEDGTAAAGDVLIGCDGVHSRTRTLIAADAPAPRYLGLLNFGGYTSGVSGGEAGAWHMIFGAQAFFGYTADNRGGTVWFANVPRHACTAGERDATTAEEWKRWLVDRFAHDRGPAVALITSGELQLAADNTHDLPTLPMWHHSRAIIIGDAAHAPSPSSGQGASMAMEDGVILAQHLRDIPNVEHALAAFSRARRRRVERIVAQGARSSSSKAAGPVGRVLRDSMLPFIFRYLVTEKSLAWMYDHHIEWDRRISIEMHAA